MPVFYTNPRLSALLVLFVLLMGTTALLGLARQEDPTMTERWASISTFLPGATAERVESLVSEPIEIRLREIPEIRTIDSNSRAGYSLVGIELYDHVGPGENDVVWSEVRDKLAEVHAQLPAGATVPELEMRAPLASTLIVALSWTLDTPEEMSILSRLSRVLEIRLANIAGTKETDVYGAVDEEVIVKVDPYQLSASGLTAAAVADRIRRSDTKIAAGRLRSPQSDLIVEVEAELDTPERIARIPLKDTETGRVLRVSDIASVTKQFVDPPLSMAFHSNQRTVFVSAKMEPNLRIDRWVDSALAAVDRFEAELPRGVRAAVVYNQNDYTGARMASLTLNLVTALLIVIVTLVWFMGVRSALTVGIALPLSGAMVLGFMHLLDIPLHQMSVTGLIISLGLLIDNAIVVVEEFKLGRSRGLAIADAIGRALDHLRIPLAASTATTVFAFLTIAMAPGGVGDFTGTIGLSVVLAVSSSYVLAMSVVPALAGHLERWFGTGDGTAWWTHGYRNARLLERYRASVTAAIRRPWLGIGIGCVLPFAGFALAPTLTQQFFPPVDRNQFQVQISLPAQASIQESRTAMETADAVLRATPGVTDTHWTVGEGAPRTYYNVLAQNDGVASFAGGWVDTDSPERTLAILPEVQRRLSSALPNAQVLALPFEQGPPFEAPILIRVIGPDIAALRDVSDQLRLILSRLDAVTYTSATVSSAMPKIVFRPEENTAAAVGMTTGDLPLRLNDSLVGVPAGTVQEGNTELGVRVRLPDTYRDEVHELASLPLASSAGGVVPLEQLGEWSLRPSVSGIQRYQGERVSLVKAYLEPFVLPAAVMAEFRQQLDLAGIVLPAGVRLDIGGEEEERSESIGNLLSVFVIFAAAMAAVVILSLNSFRQAGIVALVGFLSFGLALFGVRIFGWPFGFQALIGTLGMVGLSINGAIIVISALKLDARVLSGDRDAAVDVVVDATRHIVSTTVTTIGGFIPLILFGGTFWPPLATAIAGGVAGSAIIALYTVPTLFVHLTRQRSGGAHDAVDNGIDAVVPFQASVGRQFSSTS
ncbi:MAG: efflux RND transporter permease subunit [Pseudomonadales bacterium]